MKSENPASPTTESQSLEKVLKTALRIAPNKPLVSHNYTADPSARVFEGRLYIYPSHDTDQVFPADSNGGQYQMADYHVLSFGAEDTSVTDHGVALSLADIPWAGKQLWAPDAAYKNGVYHLFFPAKDREGIFRIGVAESASPSGPFTAESHPIAESYSIDPTAFTDEDGRTYLFFGGIWGGQLQSWTTGKYVADAKSPSGSMPGWTTQHSIVEYMGKWYIFYHDCELSGGVDSQRNVKYTELFYNADGRIQKVVH